MTSYVNLDFETYSEAGYYFDGRWRSVAGGQQGGLRAVGAAVYAEHPSTEVLVACYRLGGDDYIHTWVPGAPDPVLLLDAVRDGALVYAFNSLFEWLIWEHVCRRLHGWPELKLENMRDTMARARAYGLPGNLKNAAAAMGLGQQKDTGGKGLIRRFSVPRSPSKKNLRLRNYLGDDPENAYRFYFYCAQDVRVESTLAESVPELSDYELEVWKLDQKINTRGVGVDLTALQDCRVLVKGITERLTHELVHLTNGRIQTVGQIAEIGDMFSEYRIPLPNMQADTLKDILKDETHPVHSHPWAKRVLEIRQDLASASVKKLQALERRLCSDGRVRDLFSYCGAERTGRWTGGGPQPQNLPRGDAHVVKCEECGRFQGSGQQCFHCLGPLKKAKWNFDAAVQALESFRDQDIDNALNRWGDVLAVVAGSLRSLFVAAPGFHLVASDYRAIEAVVLAALAGEEWRLNVFRTHGKIYEQSASKITGIPFEEYLAYKERTGEHHPTRQSIGKVAELACLGRDTEVFTDSGWKRIIDVTLNDKLHDGVEWVEHGGVVSRGERTVLWLGGVWMTPDHKVYTGCGIWERAGRLSQYDVELSMAWGVARGMLYERVGDHVGAPLGDVPEDLPHQAEVFDILDVGPRNRFVIRTGGGPLIVHNSGYQGGIGAWKNFGAGDHMTDEEIRINVKRWRAESPNVVAMWKGLERAAVLAIKHPGYYFPYRDIQYHCDGKVLRCYLPSGRPLVYHNPSVVPGTTRWGAPTDRILFWGFNTNPKYGRMGWTQMDTYGGKLTENVVQATSRDILAHGMLNAAAAGYNIVLHVHDEIVCEQPEGHGSVEELERLMGDLPPWAKDWPVIAQGGWSGHRFRKD